MMNLKETILRLPEFRDYFDPKEDLTIEKCASYLGQKFLVNSMINTMIDSGINSYKILKERSDSNE